MVQPNFPKKQKLNVFSVANVIHRTNILLWDFKKYFFSQKYTSYNKILLKGLFWFPPLLSPSSVSLVSTLCPCQVSAVYCPGVINLSKLMKIPPSLTGFNFTCQTMICGNFSFLPPPASNSFDETVFRKFLDSSLR